MGKNQQAAGSMESDKLLHKKKIRAATVAAAAASVRERNENAQLYMTTSEMDHVWMVRVNLCVASPPVIYRSLLIH